MSMAMGTGPNANDLIWGERQDRKQLQARVRTLEDRVSAPERIVNAIWRVPEGDPMLDAPAL